MNFKIRRMYDNVFVVRASIIPAIPFKFLLARVNAANGKSGKHFIRHWSIINFYSMCQLNRYSSYNQFRKYRMKIVMVQFFSLLICSFQWTYFTEFNDFNNLFLYNPFVALVSEIFAKKFRYRCTESCLMYTSMTACASVYVSMMRLTLTILLKYFSVCANRKQKNEVGGYELGYSTDSEDDSDISRTFGIYQCNFNRSKFVRRKNISYFIFISSPVSRIQVRVEFRLCFKYFSHGVAE